MQMSETFMHCPLPVMQFGRYMFEVVLKYVMGMFNFPSSCGVI